MPQLIHNLEALHLEPEMELSDLFLGLYNFYNRKSYFLELMFADVIHENNSAVQAIIFEIRKAVGNYLTQILEKGKKTGVFNFQVSTRHQVESILYRFRFFMSDMPMTHKMISDLKMLRENEE